MKYQSAFPAQSFLSIVIVCVVLNLFTFQASARIAFNSTADDPATDDAASTKFLEPIELEIINEINLARANPQQYAAHLVKIRGYYVGNNFKSPDGRSYTCVEGVKALDEAIAFLRAAKPLPPLKPSFGMSRGARDHFKDLIANNATGHKGSDGSLTDQRLNRYGAWTDSVGENISYVAETAREIVIEMIIDDGNPKRGHRANLFSSTYRATGVAAGKRATKGNLCIINFAGDFSEKPANQPGDKSKPVPRKF